MIEAKTRIRRAQLVAEAVSVCCPRCGDAQPNKNGSELWTSEDFMNLEGGIRPCVSCEERMLIVSDSKVMFQ
jgi:hypothetical protein